ncbi:hypothetical protein C3432_16035 [Citrobacter amalonaticus]|uniref:IclR-ED domain-containing protein n=2 Tax=Citrobacter amalonaticus TaxID=35703 RepID=A0A2S4RT51_CITAM|nr:hypothetical protein C3432_16035 [Citrobacter amalonaticus]POT71865.1 hypothetical protein C3436_21830 [Citrobacter amalonaticus]POU63005.1 hypothetical protein C3430_20085 [Citrobacter amalonaticus]POV04781.1 hypothetical protein C3424_16830 [Citrobacter amalonaticus]
MRHIGNHLPAHCTAVGKVLLSQYSDEDIRQLYGEMPLEKMTVDSISTLPMLLAELREVRQQGYAIEQREANERAACIALPIFSSAGKMVAAFSVTVLAWEWESLAINDVLAVMKECRVLVQ